MYFHDKIIHFLPGIITGLIWLLISKNIHGKIILITSMISLIPTLFFTLQKKKQSFFYTNPSHIQRPENFYIRKPTPFRNDNIQVKYYSSWKIDSILEGFAIFFSPFSVLLKFPLDEQNNYPFIYYILYCFSSLFFLVFLLKIEISMEESKVYYQNIVQHQNDLLNQCQHKYFSDFIPTKKQQEFIHQNLSTPIKNPESSDNFLQNSFKNVFHYLVHY